ncbi:PGRPS1 [Trypoxylus dichotomus]
MIRSICFLLLLSTEISLIFANLPDVCPQIISKTQWGGRDSAKVQHIIIPLKYVIIHHTATPGCSDEEACSKRIVNMQSYHMDKLGFDDIGYNFLIGGDGNVYSGAGWHRQGAHTKGYNTKSIGIGFIGDYSSKSPSATQIEAAKKLIQCGVALRELDERYKLLGARSVRPTESPGTALYREIQKWRGFTTTP